MTKTSLSRCPACGRKETRSTQANRRYWSLLTAASEKLRPGGQQYGVEAFHIYYKTRFLGAEEVMLPNHEIAVVTNSSADLEPEDFAVYMEQVEADLAERGVYLPEAA